MGKIASLLISQQAKKKVFTSEIGNKNAFLNAYNCIYYLIMNIVAEIWLGIFNVIDSVAIEFYKFLGRRNSRILWLDDIFYDWFLMFST